MKILNVYKCSRPESIGGTENFMQSLCLELQKNNVTSDILTTTLNDSHVSYDNGTKIYAYRQQIDKFSCPVSLDLLKNFRRVASQYDLIHYHFPWPFADALHVFSKIKKPSVLTYHSDIVRQKRLNVLYKPLLKQFFNRIDRIVATSENLLKSSTLLQQYPDKSTYIPLSISESLYPAPPKEKMNHWQNKLGFRFFLFLGVLRYYKGLQFLLDAVAHTNLPLVIAGAGPEEKKLKEQAEKLNIKNVIFLGHISDEDKLCLLNICHAVVCPSHLRSEAFGITLLEGLMHQKPLISTELGTGTSFVNANGKSGLVVPPGRADLLREAMSKLYTDDNLYAQLKAGAEQHYQTFFKASNMGSSYLKLYQSCLRLSQEQKNQPVDTLLR